MRDGLQNICLPESYLCGSYSNRGLAEGKSKGQRATFFTGEIGGQMNIT